ncbi:DUF58 domain-containing protein [Pollutibacter soli]|uniref:DUF58 domain-containing protein n=1 Tax=Pollutibacter soli TaxID=3034157 RepID=UPI003013E41C
MSRLLDPAVMMSLKNLPLAARTTIDGFTSGINKSKVKGPGLEFSQYRSYEPGDDLRWLDWKLYARSDRYYIRESEIDTSIFVRFVVDASASMLHRDGDFTKIDYARYLVATLGWLAYQQTDGIGLYVLQDNKLFSLPVKNDFQHLNRFCHRLEQIEPGGKFTTPVQYRDLFSGSYRRELLIFVTDLYQEENEIMQMLDGLSAQRHEIIVFHIMAQNELEFDFNDYNALEDLETGQQVVYDGLQDKTQMKHQMQEYFTRMKKKMVEKNIYYRMMRIDEPLEVAMRDFLKQRNQFKS